ncbi:hypothetical protein [Solimonas variicoloris]|uniref:hypothetical protein n=1 Tax=Solimonas variicoloris TaxID=254408 RepID=UPI0003673D95|nr:hypothetical protein [Solimonas variicoloris]
MAKLAYLLDLPVLAELTRPNGNRRVFTLFEQRQALCAIAAPASYALLRGLELMHEGERRQQLQAFATELLASGPATLPFDGDSALWLARNERERARRGWSSLDGQLAAIAATHELALVTRSASAFAGLAGLRVEDWFRP